MGKKKVVIDTNNLISALGWEGNSRELIRRVLKKEYEFIISIKQIDELKRVLGYPRFKFTDKQKKKFLEIILEIATIIDTKKELDVVDDKKDNIIIKCAVEGNADYIITGDNDLLRLEKFENIQIIRVKEFLKL